MTLEEVKERIYEVIESYFAGATVLWEEQANTKPPLPYTILKLGQIKRAEFPIEEETEDRERSYQCSSILEVNLYTKGKPAVIGKTITSSYINTALSDLTQFTNYLQSEYITDLLSEDGIGISLMPPERDVSFLENKNDYRYRAMAEYAVFFVMEANGAYGIGGMEVPNASGGCTKELADTPIEPMKDVQIEVERGNEDEE